jgi:two-component system, chemotaxis family, chemotaxis protein CheY
MNPKQAGILVVHQVPLVRQQIASIFAAEGLPKVTEVGSPEEALQLLDTKPCHLVVSDVHFPKGEALDFLKKVRAHSFPRVRKIGFVVLTADSTKESIEAFIGAGADDYILKPLTPNYISSRITSLLMKISADQ